MTAANREVSSDLGIPPSPYAAWNIPKATITSVQNIKLWFVYLIDGVSSMGVRSSVSFFSANFRNLRPKQKGLPSPTKVFLRFFKTNSPYLDKKNLEVARFRQCVSVGRQN
jgi:hypothetical protein